MCLHFRWQLKKHTWALTGKFNNVKFDFFNVPSIWNGGIYSGKYLNSIFSKAHSLCLLWVNAGASGCGALWSSLFTSCVCSSRTLYSLQCPVFNQCDFSISRLFAESEEANDMDRRWKSLLWKDEWDPAGRWSGWFTIAYLVSQATREYISQEHWEFLIRGRWSSLNFLASASPGEPVTICCPL